MDKWQTQHQFWSSFGIPAYDEQTSFTKGEAPSFPHLTYEGMTGIFNQTMRVSASLWYRSSSWKEISQKADEILKRCATKPLLKVDGGYYWITIPDSTPFAQRMASGSDDTLIKRIYLVVDAEFLTAD